MKILLNRILLALIICGCFNSCVGKKKFVTLEDEFRVNYEAYKKCEDDFARSVSQINQLKQDKSTLESTLAFREEQITDLKDQLEDSRRLRDKQLSTVDDLTVLSKSANDNISETLSQLEKKDGYIQILQAAKTRADSVNLALAVNLKGVLSDGIADNDIEVKVDKTVVFINLSDKMLYQSGSSVLTLRAREVLGKIATILNSRPEMEMMVEGYTDNVPINSACMQDNWDLSVKRATAVVRVLQRQYGISPDRLIAAGRGEYNALASNDTKEGRSINRRTRIIILPKLDQFYDLLNPDMAP